MVSIKGGCGTKAAISLKAVSTAYEINGFYYIYNTIGQIVKSGEFNSNPKIDISDLNNNAYILSIESEMTLYYARFTKVK